ncbi:hypothetical protein Nepgr_024233 [Nepenthes gracilis]|uniref:Fatty acyl-CoA reductase n=1 Tax=Nepenthes gracilis TaxID=150966 RepID=A0AAD3T3X3_NEPGR|nr:hypothetical protein Nepgr_024233 [Nepenthes gracilis]
MEFGSILQFLEKKTILITGGAGFLAKVFVEKVLRSQPNVEKLYLLLRADDNKKATQRFQNEVIGKDLFRVLKEKMGTNFNSFISDKVTVVPGDISFEDLAIKDANLKEEMWRNIEVIVNLAATTRFDERYDISLNINAFGAKYVLDFARKCSHIKILVHVSTAYVSGARVGLIQEEPPVYLSGDTHNLDVEYEKRLVHQKLHQLRVERATDDSIKLAMKELGLQRASEYGWPNVYVFTKALGEMILLDIKNDIPLIIIRPTSILSTYKEPFPGWIEGFRTMDSLLVGYGKRKLKCIPCYPETIIDLIPADMVINAIIVAMVAHTNHELEKTTIYHMGSSARNPVTYTHIADIAHLYFTKNPLIDKKGKAIIIDKIKLLSKASFRRYLTMHYLLPLKILKLANIASCQYFQRTCEEKSKKINSLLQLTELYIPYLFFKSIFDDTNTKKLWVAFKEIGVETDVFYFDPEIIDWEEYITNTHFPGLVKYVVR